MIQCDSSKAGVYLRRIRQVFNGLDNYPAPERTKRLMRGRELISCKFRNYMPKTSDERANFPSANRITNISPSSPNDIWVGYISYSSSSNGLLYWAVVVRERYFQRVRSWSLADHVRAVLNCDSLYKFIAPRPRTQDVIFHTDRGSQYGSWQFRSFLRSYKMFLSRSARAKPYSNTRIISFIGTMKKKMNL